jgi:Flp pilus assembly pilin Flp
MGRKLAGMLTSLYRDESGATTVEYALIAALIVLVSVLVIAQLQQSLGESITQQKNYFEGGK